MLQQSPNTSKPKYCTSPNTASTALPKTWKPHSPPCGSPGTIGDGIVTVIEEPGDLGNKASNKAFVSRLLEVYGCFQEISFCSIVSDYYVLLWKKTEAIDYHGLIAWTISNLRCGINLCQGLDTVACLDLKQFHRLLWPLYLKWLDSHSVTWKDT